MAIPNLSHCSDVQRAKIEEVTELGYPWVIHLPGQENPVPDWCAGFGEFELLLKLDEIYVTKLAYASSVLWTPLSAPQTSVDEILSVEKGILSRPF